MEIRVPVSTLAEERGKNVYAISAIIMRCEHIFYNTPLVAHRFYVKEEKNKNICRQRLSFLWVNKCVA